MFYLLTGDCRVLRSRILSSNTQLMLFLPSANGRKHSVAAELLKVVQSAITSGDTGMKPTCLLAVIVTPYPVNGEIPICWGREAVLLHFELVVVPV